MISKVRRLLLPFFWLLALGGLLALAAAFRSSSNHFFGIVENQEQIIRFQYPVEITQALVLPGKQVNEGELLLTVKRHELASNQTVLDEQIRQYQLKKHESDNTLSSQINNLSAKKKAVLADMDHQIHLLELNMKQNATLLSSISGISSEPSPPASELIELTDLKKKRLYSAQAIQVEIDNLNHQLKTINRPVDAQIAELQQRKTELQRQDTDLMVTAQFDGQISAVNFKAGELVSPFEPVMSIHSLVPQGIKGYIHESILNNIKIGQTVWLKSFNPERNQTYLTGVVESLGNRIVEYPERLQVNQAVGAWGREVVIQLTNKQNTLLFGEKVQVFLTKPDDMFAWLNLIKPLQSLSKSEPSQKI